MSEERELKRAKAMYDAVCAMLDEQGWRYDRDDPNLCVRCDAQGEDLPIPVLMRVEGDRRIVTLLSQLPFTVPENKRTEMALAVSVANFAIADGNFDYDYESGATVFRMTSSYRDSLISKAVFEYMLYVSCKTVDEFNDKFLMICKGKMTAAELLSFFKG